MTQADGLDRAVRWAVCIAVLAAGILFWPPSTSVFHLPKLTAIAVCAMAAVAVMGARLVLTREGRRAGTNLRRETSKDLVVWATVGLVLALAWSLGWSDRPLRAIVGVFGRYVGVGPYLMYLALFVATWRGFSSRSIRPVLRSLAVSAVIVSAYGLLQVAGMEPVDYQTFDLRYFSTMGNVNFAAAFAAIGLPVALWAIRTSPRRSGWWWAGWVGGAVILLYVFASGATQGIAVALVAASAFAFLVAGQRLPSHWSSVGSRSVRWVLGLGALALAGIGGVVLFPYVSRALGTRVDIYEVAWRIIRERPLTGVGFGSFLDYFTLYRSLEHAQQFTTLTSNTAHSVPLEMFVAGGILLGVAYLLFVLAIGWTAVRGLSNATGYHRESLTAVAAVWLGYQTQSLISIDVPPLAVIHFVSAGAIVALAKEALTEDGASASRGRRPVPTGALVSAAVIVVLLLPLVTRPMRADLAVSSAVDALNRGDVEAAIDGMEKAQDLAPWEPTYAYLAATTYERIQRPEQAAAAIVRAAELEAGSAQYAFQAGQFAAQLGDQEAAQRWFDEAARRDPLHIGFLLNVAQAHREIGASERAADIYRRVLELDPDNAAALEGLEELSGG